MEDTMLLSHVMSHLPEEWNNIPVYLKSFMLFVLSVHSQEYQNIKSYFHGAHINNIQRVQNPFQYGRYMLRREMLQTTYENIVFHGVHLDDVDIALKFNCDYRRYHRKCEGLYEKGQHPMFYQSFSELLNKIKHPITDINVLVLRILTIKPQTQCDYYIKYIVKF